MADTEIGHIFIGPGNIAPFIVFDLMEPLRPVVDRKLLELVQTETFDPCDFTIRSDGVCRLNPELARHLAKLAANTVGPWGLEVPGVPRALGLSGAQTERVARCSGEKNLARKRERLKKWQQLQ